MNMALKEKVAEIRDALIFIADALRGPVAVTVTKPLHLNVSGLTGIKKSISVQSVATMLQTAAAELDSLNFDNAERELNRAQKEWAKVIKEQGRSKELTKLLNIIINLKQEIKDAKASM